MICRLQNHNLNGGERYDLLQKHKLRFLIISPIISSDLCPYNIVIVILIWMDWKVFPLLLTLLRKYSFIHEENFNLILHHILILVVLHYLVVKNRADFDLKIYESWKSSFELDPNEKKIRVNWCIHGITHDFIIVEGATHQMMYIVSSFAKDYLECYSETVNFFLKHFWDYYSFHYSFHYYWMNYHKNSRFNWIMQQFFFQQ